MTTDERIENYVRDWTGWKGRCNCSGNWRCPACALRDLLAVELDAARAREATLEGQLAATEMRLVAAEQSHDAAGRKVIQMAQSLRVTRAREAKLRAALGRYSVCQRNDGRLLSCARLRGEGETVTFCVRCAALAEGEDTREAQ